MSHELRTPLNAIIGFSDTMHHGVFGPLGNGKYREYVEDILGSARHLLDIINDVLDVSKIEAGAFELSEEVVEFAPVVEASLRLIGARAKQGGVRLTSRLDHDLPVIRVDPRRLKQILVNLLSNAVKFTPAGGEVCVEAAENDGGGMLVRVSDTGVGMTEAEMAKALSLFGQVDGSLERTHEGTGLGLPLTVRLVEAHGGAFDLQSTPDRGTTAVFSLPPERCQRAGEFAGKADGATRWDPSYRSGSEVVDLDHRGLLDQVGRLDALLVQGWYKEALRQYLARMLDETATHFQAEEAYLDEVDYPGLAWHISRHESVMAETSLLMRSFEAAETRDKEAVIAKEICRILLDHFLDTDLSFIAKAKRRNPPSSAAG